MLEGPTGTDLYQEALVRALTKQFNAQLLVIDNAYFEAKEKAGFAHTSAPSSQSPISALPSVLASSSRHTLPELSSSNADDDDGDYSSEEYGRRLNTFDVSKRRFKIGMP